MAGVPKRMLFDRTLTTFAVLTMLCCVIVAGTGCGTNEGAEDAVYRAETADMETLSSEEQSKLLSEMTDDEATRATVQGLLDDGNASADRIEANVRAALPIENEVDGCLFWRNEIEQDFEDLRYDVETIGDIIAVHASLFTDSERSAAAEFESGFRVLTRSLAPIRSFCYGS